MLFAVLYLSYLLFDFGDEPDGPSLAHEVKIWERSILLFVVCYLLFVICCICYLTLARNLMGEGIYKRQ